MSRAIILIDGPSGSGKTTFAGVLGDKLGWPVLHCDDFYPGWSGLADASRIIAGSILGGAGTQGFYRWDWVNERPGEWVDTPSGPLIIEGTGSMTAETIAAARAWTGDGVITVRIDAPEAVRKTRALERDPDYAPWWDMWARQERVHFAGPGAVDADFEFYDLA